MARSRKRKTTGETTQLFRPTRQKKIKKRRFWPYFLMIILLGVAGYYFWDEFVQPPQMPPELTRHKKETIEPEILPNKQKVLADNKKPESTKNDIKTAEPTKEKSFEKKINTPVNENIKTNDKLPSQLQHNIQVEILNGCGVQGMAAHFAKILRDQGVDVVKTGNYKSLDVKNTQVMDRIGNKGFALQVGNILGVESKYIYTQKKKELLIDATIIIGKDYAKLKKK